MPIVTDESYGGLPTLRLRAADDARVDIALHGAHVLSWRPARGGERLFLSERSAFREGEAIRGGIPVIFPQFADRGPYTRHGFARTRAWEPVDERGDSATLRLTTGPDTLALWPFAFVAELTVRVDGDALATTLDVRNTGGSALDFTAALHTYLRVPHIGRAAVGGLRGARYLDTTAGGVERLDDAGTLMFAGEVDRIYLDAPRTVVLRDVDRPLVEVHGAGFRDVVVWNPGAERAASFPGLEPGGESRFVCIEAAAAGAPVSLAPGARWAGTQTLVAVGDMS